MFEYRNSNNTDATSNENATGCFQPYNVTLSVVYSEEEYPDLSEAYDMLQPVLLAVGRLPRVFTQMNLQEMHIFNGSSAAGGGGGAISYHMNYLSNSNSDWLEELFAHEAAHVSLDWARGGAVNEDDWHAVQEADCLFLTTYGYNYPDREDVAETFLPWFACRYYFDRVGAGYCDEVRATVPNRLQYFDDLMSTCHDLSPVDGTECVDQGMGDGECVVTTAEPTCFTYRRQQL